VNGIEQQYGEIIDGTSAPVMEQSKTTACKSGLLVQGYI